ncbi:winged helix-turn-helix domain-containing protein [Thalassomonas haliotis]|uniref:Winged helix-turn-helix domain-containing protein n=1 Tax=Thalassomonas haliotis TaxID=485448 RepID=A0ABY7VES2_9GAMM|nr:winged helix-turn-helix domain-containing protein [Thalassomonas haliotis]WDE12179.1 winged helix-turn-helix domain-containing protein [Thalassomonas haliotis]
MFSLYLSLPVLCLIVMSAAVKKYRFLHWEFDCQQDSLRHVDEQVSQKLEPQAAALLLLLIENREKVFSKEELSRALWPDTVVEENSVYQLLTKLRKVLRDPPKQAQIIKTFPKKGYRLICEVKRCEAGESGTQSDEKIREQLAVPQEPENTSGGKQATNKKQEKRFQLTLITVFFLLLGFTAIAYFSIQSPQETPVNYSSLELTTALGLESWPAAHPLDGSIVYIKDGHQLWRKGKNTYAEQIFESPDRLFYPAWSIKGDNIALWQLKNTECLLTVRDKQGNELTRSPLVRCDYVGRLLWLDDNRLLAIYRTAGLYRVFQYDVPAGTFTEIPLVLNEGERLRTVVKAWQDKIFYITVDANYHSRLIDKSGIAYLSWDYPVKFAAFDSKQQRLLINDKSKHQGLSSFTLDGQQQNIAQTARGIFSAIAADHQGNLYATVENWQVNIRDKDNLPVFSSTSLDYLPVSNALGETAFMSRRGGFCQIYLHEEGKVKQLSHFNNYDKVKFVRWSPDLSLILTNRDNSAYIYNRNGLVNSFALVTPDLPVSFGWLSKDKIYSFDGDYLRYYLLSGQKVAEFQLDADNVFYQADKQLWWLFNNNRLYAVGGELLDTAQLTEQLKLSGQQGSKISDIRMVGNRMYWKSRSDHQDFIWQYQLNDSAPALIKRGRFIWNYDVNSGFELSVAVKEHIEGNIRFYKSH